MLLREEASMGMDERNNVDSTITGESAVTGYESLAGDV
jgi:hypothetical protein